MGISGTHPVQVVPLGPLTFVYYDEPACRGIAVHCLELDIGGQGPTREAATKDLQHAIEVYVKHHLDQGEIIQLRPAPSDLQALADRERFQALLIRYRESKSRERRELVLMRPPERFAPQELALT
jgi:predicted RNase H-like HicB family nuclease